MKAELSHDGAVVPGEVEDHGDGTYTITLTSQTACPHQLLITMDGQHVYRTVLVTLMWEPSTAPYVIQSKLSLIFFASHMLLDTLLPMDTITAISSGVHSSNARDRTREMCDPSILWTPEHSMHRRQPRFRQAHSGSV